MTLMEDPKTEADLRDLEFVKTEIARLQRLKAKRLLKLKVEVNYCCQVKSERKDALRTLRTPRDLEEITFLRKKYAKARKDVHQAQEEYSALLDMLRTFEQLQKNLRVKLRYDLFDDESPRHGGCCDD